MEVDTGASVAVVGEDVYNALFGDSKLFPTPHLSAANGSKIRTLGELAVEVTYKGQVVQDSLVVAAG